MRAKAIRLVLAALALTGLLAGPSAAGQTQGRSPSDVISLQAAAKKGDARSQCLLGLGYLRGDGVIKNERLAVEWFQKSAKQGFMQAQNALGLLLLDGTGVPQSNSKAAYWFKKAADQGDELAQKNLEVMRSQGKLGNFRGWQENMNRLGWFDPGGEVNGFTMYTRKNNQLNTMLMRSCDDNCCEGLISVQPMEAEELEAYINFIYAPLQNTLHLTGKKSVANGFKERVTLLRKQIMANMKQSNLTQFAFDHLNVRAQCTPVSNAEYKAGNRPQLTVKLWIP